jgi:hypothetical protein
MIHPKNHIVDIRVWILNIKEDTKITTSIFQGEKQFQGVPIA